MLVNLTASSTSHLQPRYVIMLTNPIMSMSLTYLCYYSNIFYRKTGEGFPPT